MYLHQYHKHVYIFIKSYTNIITKSEQNIKGLKNMGTKSKPCSYFLLGLSLYLTQRE